jgi:hypothetical protein
MALWRNLVSTFLHPSLSTRLLPREFRSPELNDQRKKICFIHNEVWNTGMAFAISTREGDKNEKGVDLPVGATQSDCGWFG